MSSPSPDWAGSRGAVAADPPPSASGGPPTAAPYFPPPPYPPPGVGRGAPIDGRAITSLAASILGILLGLPFGLPGLALGPVGYFMGRAAIARIDGAPGTAGGRSLAVAGRALGVVATAIGALISLAWLVLLLFVAAAAPAVG